MRQIHLLQKNNKTFWSPCKAEIMTH